MKTKIFFILVALSIFATNVSASNSVGTEKIAEGIIFFSFILFILGFLLLRSIRKLEVGSACGDEVFVIFGGISTCIGIFFCTATLPWFASLTIILFLVIGGSCGYIYEKRRAMKKEEEKINLLHRLAPLYQEIM